MKYVQQVRSSITSLTVTELTAISRAVTEYVNSAGSSSNAFSIRFLFKSWPVAICTAWGSPRLPEPLPPLRAEIVNEWDSLKHVCNTVYGNSLVALFSSFFFIIYSDTSCRGSPNPIDTDIWCGGNDRCPGSIRKSVLSRTSRCLATSLTKLARLLTVLTITINGGFFVFRDSQNPWRRKLMATQTISLHRFMTWSTLLPLIERRVSKLKNNQDSHPCVNKVLSSHRYSK
jgi:hypothetical protein